VCQGFFKARHPGSTEAA